MKMTELIAILERLAPRRLALSWDNPGLICGRKEKEIRKVLLALDAEADTVECAVQNGADLLLTHHPMIFREIRQVNDETPLGRKLLRLIGADICCYAMHTNFDIAPGCMADVVCERMGLIKEAPLEPSVSEAGEKEDYGVGFIASTRRPVTAAELSEQICRAFELPSVTLYDSGRPVRRAAVVPGSGRGMLPQAASAKADLFVTGDMGHHDGMDALDLGMSLIDAGHYGLEHVFVPFMKERLARECPELCILTEEKDRRRFVRP